MTIEQGTERSIQQPQYWSPTETDQNLAQFQNQYIRVHITGLGWVIAQLLGQEPGGVVMLNVYRPGSNRPEFMRINRRDLTGLTPLGYSAPPEITGGAYPPAQGGGPAGIPWWLFFPRQEATVEGEEGYLIWLPVFVKQL